jgi:hypothetical protein
VIPLGLHVDYWDYLGWPDRFAQAIFTERQRTIAAWHRTRTIYTPQLVVQGEDFRRWGSLERRLEQINATPARAQLRLHVTVQTPATLAVDAEAVVSAGAERQDARLYMALYENNLRSQVTAGENSGHTLQHDFVVRQWLEPLALDQTQGRVQVQRTLSVPRDWKLADLGLVMFVQNHRSGEVLQALALALR